MKSESKINSGRSMVEMLGVLAIIGILSVGGIAGYSKAMMQFKINKTMSQVSYISSALRTLFGTKDTYTSLASSGAEITNVTLLEKAKIVPDELINIDKDGKKTLKSPFGSVVDVLLSDLSYEGDDGAFMIYYYNIPREACITIAARDWGSSSSSGFVAIGINKTRADMKALYQGCSKSAEYGNAVTCGPVAGSNATGLEPLSLAEAASACVHATQNAIAWKFY